MALHQSKCQRHHLRSVNRKPQGYLRPGLAFYLMWHNIVSYMQNAERGYIKMLKIIFPAMMILMTLPGVSSRDAQAQSLDLSVFQWKNRLLLLFAPNRNHPMFDALHKSLAARQSEASDRDLVILEILESSASSMNNESIDSETARLLREKFDPHQDEFTVILIGKDGGIKLTRKEETKLDDIFALIDSMPMRQDEMRQRN